MAEVEINAVLQKPGQRTNWKIKFEKEKLCKLMRNM